MKCVHSSSPHKEIEFPKIKREAESLVGNARRKAQSTSGALKDEKLGPKGSGCTSPIAPAAAFSTRPNVPRRLPVRGSRGRPLSSIRTALSNPRGAISSRPTPVECPPRLLVLALVLLAFAPTSLAARITHPGSLNAEHASPGDGRSACFRADAAPLNTDGSLARFVSLDPGPFTRRAICRSRGAGSASTPWGPDQQGVQFLRDTLPDGAYFVRLSRGREILAEARVSVQDGHPLGVETALLLSR